MASRWPDDRATALLLFDHLTEPHAGIRGPLLGLPSGLEVGIRGDKYWLSKAWPRVFVPHLAEAASEVIAIVDAHLRRAYRMLTADGVTRPGRDPLSVGRSAIEPHPQDEYRKPIDILVDAARDCVEALLPGSAGAAYLDSWAASDVPLLRRLAIHGWTYRNDASDTEKLMWLRDRRWLLDSQLWHEVFRLIEATIGGADREVADAVVADVLAAPDTAASDYKKFSALSWIARHAPELESARVAFAQVQADHPNYREGEHPEFRTWLEGGGRKPRPPMSTEELHQRIEADPAGAIAELREYEGVDHSFDGTSWEDATALIAATIQGHPDDGFRLFDAGGSDHADIADAIIRGWSGAALDDTASTAVVQRLEGIRLAPVMREVARMLAGDGQHESAPTAWHQVPGSRELAAKVWAALDSKPPGDATGNDWLTIAINHPAGWLTQFWLNATASDWRAAATDSWTGLPTTLRSQLEDLVGGDDDRTAMAQVILASRLQFLHAADQEWAEHTILPLLDWSDEARARRAWDGFLTGGRWNDRLIDAGLLDFYLATAERIDQFPDDVGHQLLEHLATVAVFADTDPITSEWVRRFTRAADTKTRTEWLRRVGWLLSELDADAVEHQWTRWIHTYWTDRLHSRPIALTDEEASAIAAWVVYLTGSLAAGVTLVEAHPAGIEPHSSFLDDLSERADRAPTEFAALLTHLLRGTKPPFYEGNHLQKMVRCLRPMADVNPIIEEAVRLGCVDAPSW